MAFKAESLLATDVGFGVLLREESLHATDVGFDFTGVLLREESLHATDVGFDFIGVLLREESLLATDVVFARISLVCSPNVHHSPMVGHCSSFQSERAGDHYHSHHCYPQHTFAFVVEQVFSFPMIVSLQARVSYLVKKYSSE